MMSALQNPAAILQQAGINPNALQNPQAAIQDLLNSGRMTQEQYNQFYQMAQQLQGNPGIAQALNGMRR
jgi:hypothetical protein